MLPFYPFAIFSLENTLPVQVTFLNLAFDVETVNLCSRWIKVGDSRPVGSDIVGTHVVQVSLA
jgi:hypothetical protein